MAMQQPNSGVGNHTSTLVGGSAIKCSSRCGRTKPLGLFLGIPNPQTPGRIQKVDPLKGVPIKYPVVVRAPN